MASARDLLAKTSTVAGAQAAFESLIAIAFADSVTGLHNRRALDEIIKLQFAFEASYGVVMADLTGFKRVNDEGSHAAGDAALKTVGETLSELCIAAGPFSGALPFRYGGDEFCILVPKALFVAFTDGKNLERLQWNDFSIEDKNLGFRASLGFSEPDESVGLRELIDRADIAAKVSKLRDDAPTAWDASLQGDEIVSTRQKCASCFATTSVSVVRARLVADRPKPCANCGQVLS